ncbi:Uncharacterised protein [Mycobacterium tuberculosis]|uniref:Uncharacterized protein n=1 Tax=Mycobacterium tuberculosis TaxID=1773 RepID=A0A0U0T980_MYCTX|nr:Uncharacterised protein [Mycobacterium tuberculosis]CFE68813.1 Uncharacterised protein [Mycobacterium tuberculosis]CKR01029.1 Uncharacterised protein [Mycobacterium tuberculosis]CKR11944.1 Uncharacterised protein [Mycobacterium tuberculosis]CKR13404.1 Uncharacterised protein [Mycobacterium tuberculosis]
MPRKLTSLTRFRALRHLDLEVGAVGQVMRGDAKPGGGYLLNGASAPIPVGVAVKSLDVLAAFTTV